MKVTTPAMKVCAHLNNFCSSFKETSFALRQELSLYHFVSASQLLMCFFARLVVKIAIGSVISS